MHDLSLLMDNMIKYGNCQIYIPCSDNIHKNRVIGFYVGENGNILVEESNKYYDKVYWDGNKLYNATELAEEFKSISTETPDVMYNIAEMVISIIYSRHTHVEVNKDDYIADHWVNKTLFNIINTMLDVPDSVLFNLAEDYIESSIMGIMNYCIKNIKDDDFSPDLAPKIIEKKCIKLTNRFQNIELLLMQTDAPASKESKRILYNIIDNISNDSIPKSKTNSHKKILEFKRRNN